MSTKINAINMLILDPSSNDAEQTINILRNNGHAVRATQILSEEDLEEALEKKSWDLFIVRDKLQNPSAEQCLKIVQHYGSDIPFIMTTPDYSVERTLEAMRLGMKDVTPEDNDEYFTLVVERELSSVEDRRNRKLADKALMETDKRNELLLDSSRDAIAYITDGMHIYVNHAYMELFGYEDAEDLECMPIMDLIDSAQHDKFKKYLKAHAQGNSGDEFEFTGLNADGSRFSACLSMTDSQYDGENCTQVYIKTSADDEQLEKKLKELSAQDRLTGLYNRHYFIESLTSAITSAATENQLAAVFYLELDKFDQIQDKYGITNGDLYLKEVSQWLKQQLPDNAILARDGDCTFTILARIKKPDEARTIATDLCEQFAAQLFEISSHTVKDTLSIGICPVQETSPGAEKVFSNAHFASSRVQSKGGNAVQLHDDTLDSLDNEEETQMAIEIQDAKDANKIHPLYEPIVKLHGHIDQIFISSLAITTDAGQDKLLSDVFDVGSTTSTALKLDNWLIKESLGQFSNYFSEHHHCKLKLNLSAASLLDESLLSRLTDALNQYELPKESLIIEFAEEDVVAHLKRAISLFTLLGEQGFTTGLSHFGSTLDSESVINNIKIDGFTWVSLDEALFNNFIGDAKAQAKVMELASFAHANELSTIAPAVTDPGILATIWPMNIGHIHGEYIASASTTLGFDFSDLSF